MALLIGAQWLMFSYRAERLEVLFSVGGENEILYVSLGDRSSLYGLA